MFDIRTKTSDYISIIVTHECNKNCPFCVDAYRGTKEFVSMESLTNAIEVAKSQQIKDILLVGGEPTLHPDIKRIALFCKEAGFRVVMTTNYSKPDIVKSLDGIVDCFNISWYGQSNLPKQSEYTSDLTISVLIFQGQQDTKEALDNFIDEHSNINLKFSTLSLANEYCAQHQDVQYLDSLPSERVILFDEIVGQIYRKHIIKRYDCVINPSALQSLKCHVDGAISSSWERKIQK